MLNKEEMAGKLQDTNWPQLHKLNPDELFYRHYKKEDHVEDQIDGKPCVGVIIYGSINVCSFANDGSEVSVSVLEEGDAFGIANVFYSSRLPTLLECLEETGLVFVPKGLFIDLLKHDEELLMHYLTVCNQKIQFLIEKVELLSMQSARNKFIQYMFAHEEDSIVILDCSREQLARRIGVSRAALFREISDLQGKGLIVVKGQKITIINEDILAKILYKGYMADF